MKVIILAAGNGSRLAPIGLTTPKLLVPILNKTILEHQVEAVADLADEVVVVVGPNNFGRLIETYITEKSWPIPISTVVQDRPLGTANAFQAAADRTKDADRVMFLLGDDLYSPVDLKKLANYPMAILGKPVDDWQKWGVLQPNNEGSLVRIVEKPDYFVGNIANTGAAVLSPKVFELYDQLKPSVRGELEFTDSMSLLAEQEIIYISTVEDYWLPVGYPWHILDAQEQLFDKVVDNFDQNLYPNVKKKGRVNIGQDVTVGANVILDNVVIGDNVTIDDDCLLSKGSIIGDRVSIGRATTIFGSTIMSETTIESEASIFHSVIGCEVRVGSGAFFTSQPDKGQGTVWSAIKGQMVNSQRTRLGAIIGDRAVIGANASLDGGVKVWPGVAITSQDEDLKNQIMIDKDIEG